MATKCLPLPESSQPRSRVKSLNISAAVVTLTLLSGCASTVGYRPDYVPDHAVASGDRIPGRILVYTTKDDDARVDTSGSTTYTGSAAQLTTPTGMMTREIALKVFSQMGTDGAIASNNLADATRCSVVVRPQALALKHGFEQLKNLGFAITPDVQYQMRISVLDASGKPLFEKDYDSGVVEGPSYMMSTGPSERINKLAHETIYAQMRRAADDVRLNRSTPPAQTAVRQ